MEGIEQGQRGARCDQFEWQYILSASYLLQGATVVSHGHPHLLHFVIGVSLSTWRHNVLPDLGPLFIHRKWEIFMREASGRSMRGL